MNSKHIKAEKNLGTISNPSTASVEEHATPETASSGLTPAQKKKATAAMLAVMKKVPELTTFGLGIYPDYSISFAKQKKMFDKERAELLEDTYLLQFTRCVCWINHEIWPIASINSNYSSYSLKHVAERDIDYITNGVFIAAAVHCGFRLKADNANPCFNISNRAVNAAIRRQERDRKAQRPYKDC